MEENKNQNTVNSSISEKATPGTVQLPNSPIVFVPYFIPYGGQNMPQGINNMPAQFGTAAQPVAQSSAQTMAQTSPMLELAPPQSNPLKILFIFGTIIATLIASGYGGYQFINRDTTTISDNASVETTDKTDTVSASEISDDPQKEASPLKGQLTIGAGTKEAEAKELPELGQASTLTSSQDLVQLKEESSSGVAR